MLVPLSLFFSKYPLTPSDEAVVESMVWLKRVQMKMGTGLLRISVVIRSSTSMPTMSFSFNSITTQSGWTARNRSRAVSPLPASKTRILSFAFMRHCRRAARSSLCWSITNTLTVGMSCRPHDLSLESCQRSVCQLDDTRLDFKRSRIDWAMIT